MSSAIGLPLGPSLAQVGAESQLFINFLLIVSNLLLTGVIVLVVLRNYRTMDHAFSKLGEAERSLRELAHMIGALAADLGKQRVLEELERLPHTEVSGSIKRMLGERTKTGVGTGPKE